MRTSDFSFSRRISEKAKYAKNLEAAKMAADSLIPTYSMSSAFLEDEKRIDDNYKLVNNELDPDILEELTNRLGIDIGQAPRPIQPFNVLSTKLGLLAGEELKRNDQTSPILMNLHSLKQRDQEYAEHIKGQIRLLVGREVAKVQAELEQMEEEEAQKVIQDIEARMTPINQPDFQSALQKLGKDIKTYMTFSGGKKFKKNKGFKDLHIAGREIVYVGYKNGKPFFDAVNTKNFFHNKSSDTPFVQDGDYAGRGVSMTCTEALSQYGRYMNNKDLTDFKNRYFTDQYSYDGTRIDPEREKTFTNRMLKGNVHGLRHNENSGYVIPNDNKALSGSERVWVSHVTWKWDRRVGFLKHMDDFGNQIVTVVDDAFIIPQHATRVEFVNEYQVIDHRWEFVDITGQPASISYAWIPRVWEATKVDNIFVNVREIPGQTTSPERIHDVQLPYYGVYMDNYNSKTVAPVDRAKPFVYLSHIIMDQITDLCTRNLGAITGFDMAQIPAALAKNGATKTEMAMFYAREGFGFYNSSEKEMGLPTNQRGKGIEVNNYDIVNTILGMMQLYDIITDKVGECLGISPAREGATSPNTNVSDNQRSVVQSSHITEPAFYLHNKMWADVEAAYINLTIDWAKKYFERNPDSNELVMPFMKDNGNQAVLKILRDGLEMAEYGVYMVGAGSAEAYLDKLEQMMLPLIQNDMNGLEEISHILKARAQGASPEEIHSMIIKITGEKREQQEKFQEIQAQQEQQRIVDAKAAIEDHQSHEIEKIVVKAVEDRITKKGVEMLKADADSDGIRDEAEREKAAKEHQIAREKNQIEREKIASNERIAKHKNANQSSGSK